MVGFQSSQFGFFLLVFFTFQLYCVFYGQAVAVWSPNAMVAMMVSLRMNFCVRVSYTLLHAYVVCSWEMS